MENNDFPLFDRRPKRKLAAILAADVVGFSKMMGENEDRTLVNLKACREITDGAIREHHGRVFGSAGDSIIAEFASPVDAVLAAVEFQKNLRDRNSVVSPQDQMQFRVGLNLGDVIVEGDNLFGDGVNVAARMEPLAKPGGICVSGKFYDEVHRKLELLFEDVGSHEVKNIANPVQTYHVILDQYAGKSHYISSRLNEETEKEKISDTTYRSREDSKPRIMLFPFRNLNNQEDNDFLVDGIVDDIITELSMINSIEVMSRQTTFDLKGKEINIKSISERYKINYFVTGSIRSSGNRVRVNAELSDSSEHGSIWSSRFDKIMDDIFEIQDEIVRRISESVLSEIEVSSLERSKRKPTDNMSSYEYLLQGKYHKQRKTKDDAIIAIEYFNKSIEIDPNNGRAYAERCCLWADGTGNKWFDEPDDVMEDKILSTLEKAYNLTGHDWDCHRILCGVSMYFNKFEEAVIHGRKAYELNPNNPSVLWKYGVSLILVHKYTQGIKLISKSLELDPQNDSLISKLVWACFAAEDYQKSLEFYEKIETPEPAYLVIKIACLGALQNFPKRDSELEVFLSKYGIERLKFEISNFKFNSYETDSLVNKYLFENENFHSSNLIKNTQESITAMNN